MEEVLLRTLDAESKRCRRKQVRRAREVLDVFTHKCTTIVQEDFKTDVQEPFVGT